MLALKRAVLFSRCSMHTRHPLSPPAPLDDVNISEVSPLVSVHTSCTCDARPAVSPPVGCTVASRWSRARFWRAELSHRRRADRFWPSGVQPCRTCAESNTTSSIVHRFASYYRTLSLCIWSGYGQTSEDVALYSGHLTCVSQLITVTSGRLIALKLTGTLRPPNTSRPLYTPDRSLIMTLSHFTGQWSCPIVLWHDGILSIVAWWHDGMLFITTLTGCVQFKW